MLSGDSVFMTEKDPLPSVATVNLRVASFIVRQQSVRGELLRPTPCQRQLIQSFEQTHKEQ